ncbi:extracellular catalytic domain type 1 short-chain-length polyhydroxyalkanoate depolymerase [Glaciimonas sp. GG7]
MLKALSRLWLRSVKSLSKAQQSQNKKIIKTFLAKPASKKSTPTKSAPGKITLITSKATKSASTTPLAGQWLSFYYAATERAPVTRRRIQYWLYLPSSASTSALAIPLVVMLHGCNQNVDDFARGTRMNALAEKQGFAVLYPQQSYIGHIKRCWNWYNRETQAGGGDARRIAAIIRIACDKYPIDKTRVYIAGLSSGASMASIVALNYPHLISAVGIHSGTTFGAGHSLISAYGVMQRGAIETLAATIGSIVQKHLEFPTMPVMLIHGLEDKVVRPVNALQLTQQFKALNHLTTDTEATITTKAASTANSRHPRHAYTIHDYYQADKLLVKVCEISQLGHAWSGGDCAIRYNACAGPDATKMLWDFFRRHRRVTAI